MNRSPSRIAYALLFAMTAMAFGGPLALSLVIEGGQHPKWPPDRPVEWATFGVVVGLTSLLLLLCLSIRWWLPAVRQPGSKLPDRPGSSEVSG